MGKADFSVSMCVYGKDNPIYFDAALDSILNQTHKPTQIVLTVDGPIPNTVEDVITKYQNTLDVHGIGFKVIRLEKNLGHGKARRICFEHCDYSLIALMDADDLSISTRFEKQLSFFCSHPDVSVVGGYITEFISADNPTDISNAVGCRIVPENDKDIKEYMKTRCPMNQVSVMFKKADVAAVGGYLDWFCEEDYYLWVRLALAGRSFGNIQENLVNVRVGKEMYHRRGGLEYFKSEARFQRFLYNNRIISFPLLLINIGKRFLVQIVLPNSLRAWVYKKMARE